MTIVPRDRRRTLIDNRFSSHYHLPIIRPFVRSCVRSFIFFSHEFIDWPHSYYFSLKKLSGVSPQSPFFFSPPSSGPYPDSHPAGSLCLRRPSSFVLHNCSTPTEEEKRAPFSTGGQCEYIYRERHTRRENKGNPLERRAFWVPAAPPSSSSFLLSL